MINARRSVQPKRVNQRVSTVGLSTQAWAPRTRTGLYEEGNGRGSVHLEHACVQHLALLERGADGAVQAVLQVQVALPLHDVREEVAVERGVLGEQCFQVELSLGRHELIEADRARRDVRPLPGAFPAVV